MKNFKNRKLFFIVLIGIISLFTNCKDVIEDELDQDVPVIGDMSYEVGGVKRTMKVKTFMQYDQTLILFGEDGNGITEANSFSVSIEPYTKKTGVFDSKSAPETSLEYSELKGTNLTNASLAMWGSNDQLVELTSVKNNVVEGTFSGTLVPLEGDAKGTLKVTNGIFKVKI